MSTDTLLIFTEESPATITRQAGTEAWVLDPKRARKCEYAVCTQNRYGERSDAVKPHGTAFIVGRVGGVVPSRKPECADRWKIVFSEWAEIDLPQVWPGLRNPIHYTSLAALGIDPAQLEFEKAPLEIMATTTTAADSRQPRALSISEAKEGLALTFGVAPDKVEITIRG